MARKKRCKVYKCEAKTLRGKPMCKEHDEMYVIELRPCNGEAHGNPFIDHCMVCMPRWGEMEVLVEKEQP
jgi:hypothetical protein